MAPRRRRFTDDGQSLIEYALMLSLVAVVCWAAVTSVGQEMSGELNRVSNSLSTVS